MKLNEGKNNWEHFANGGVSKARLEYDGTELFRLRFINTQKADECEVGLDWIEEIKSFRNVVETALQNRQGSIKVYPDDYRGLMIRVAWQSDEVELNFLKGFATVRVILPANHGEQILLAAAQLLQKPGTMEIQFK
ncbi:MAG: hypothetical protein ACM3QZ_06795 [Solirubrobacterales bacterium]